MEKNLLTTEQRTLLETIAQNRYLTKQFFFTGGTALAEFYFHHRFSEDLDFFSESEFDSRQLLTTISSISKTLKLTKIEQQTLTGQEVFYLYFADKKFVKTDFSYFPFPHLGTFKKYYNLNVSSLEDITINKIQAIITRRRARDYYDLFLCLNKLKWNASKIQKNYRLKFDVHVSLEQLATSYTNVLDAKDLPKFLGNIPWKSIEKFYLQETDKLKEKLIK